MSDALVLGLSVALIILGRMSAYSTDDDDQENATVTAIRRQVEVARVGAALGRAQPGMRQRYGPHCCIIATRIAVEAFRSRGIKAVPTPVSVSVVCEAEAAVFRMGFTGEPLDEGMWDGHLVCVVDASLMLDLTLDQAAAHMPAAKLAPVWGPAPPGFARGGVIETQIGNCDVKYVAVPDDRSFIDQRDWHDEPERRPVLAAVLADLA